MGRAARPPGPSNPNRTASTALHGNRRNGEWRARMARGHPLGLGHSRDHPCHVHRDDGVAGGRRACRRTVAGMDHPRHARLGRPNIGRVGGYGAVGRSRRQETDPGQQRHAKGDRGKAEEDHAQPEGEAWQKEIAAGRKKKIMRNLNGGGQGSGGGRQWSHQAIGAGSGAPVAAASYRRRGASRRVRREPRAQPVRQALGPAPWRRARRRALHARHVRLGMQLMHPSTPSKLDVR